MKMSSRWIWQIEIEHFILKNICLFMWSFNRLVLIEWHCEVGKFLLTRFMWNGWEREWFYIEGIRLGFRRFPVLLQVSCIMFGQVTYRYNFQKIIAYHQAPKYMSRSFKSRVLGNWTYLCLVWSLLKIWSRFRCLNNFFSENPPSNLYASVLSL